MKIKFKQPKGFRVKKGSIKCSFGRNARVNIFGYLTIENGLRLWYCKELNKWVDKIPDNYSYSNFSCNIRSLKAAIAHIKRHPEIPKGTKMMFNSNFKSYDIEITV